MKSSNFIGWLHYYLKYLQIFYKAPTKNKIQIVYIIGRLKKTNYMNVNRKIEKN